MASMFGVIFIVLLILLGMTYFRSGIDTIKENPIQSTFESGKIAFDKGKTAIQWGSEQYKAANNGTNASTED